MNIKLYLIIISITFLSSSCSSQDPLLDSFLNKFSDVELPLNSPWDCGSRHGNDPSNISQEEFSDILMLNERWIYSNEYYYNTGCKFRISKSILGLIYYRSYLPQNLDDQIGERVLLILTQDGKVVDSLPIQGNKGDNYSFSGSISSSLDIVIIHEFLSLDKYSNTIRKIKESTYKISDTGNIHKLSSDN